MLTQTEIAEQSGNFLAIGDNVQVTTVYTSGTTGTWVGVLRDVDNEWAYIQRGQSTVRERVPRSDVRSIATRSQQEIRHLIDNPIEVNAPWTIGVWSWRRFPSIAAANAELSALRDVLPRSYVSTTNDPLIVVGTYSRRGWSW